MIRNQLVKNWRDSATLIVVAKNAACNGKFKVLMLKRSPKSKFMPSSYVYPGGVTSTSDFSEEWINILKVNHANLFPTISNVSHHRPYTYSINSDAKYPDLAFRICALRETFEESGILLARDQNGRRVMFGNQDDNIGGEYSTLGKWREKVNENESNYLQLFRDGRYIPDVFSLIEWTMWLTPSFVSRRFFTMFYICFVETVLNQSEDNAEIVHSDWLNPLDALNAHSREEINLQPPQVYESCRIKGYSTAEDIKNFAKTREESGLDLWCPFMIRCKNGYIVTYPGDDLHNANPTDENVFMDCTIEELFSRSVNLNRLENHKGSKISDIRCNVDWHGHPPLGDIINSNWNNK